MKRVVISGVNIVSGGMLSVYKDCLREMLRYCRDIEVVALVHDQKLFDEIKDTRLTYRAYPRAKRSWLQRCYHEYVLFHRLSKTLHADLWLSMHDMTPYVKANQQVVYCHNTAPFYNIGFAEIFRDWKFTLFVLFYRYLYRINLHRNAYVIVQQNWMREEFQRIFSISNIIVANPRMETEKKEFSSHICKGQFLYPVTPHTYKNVEILCAAASRFEEKTEIEIILTLDGSEGSYAKDIVRKYRDVPSLKFVGRQTRERIFELYAECEALLFPSRLESWGMPLSEFMETGKPILTADLPYAHEVLDGYQQVKFLDPLRADVWNEAMQDLVRGMLKFDHIPKSSIKEPYAQNWNQLFSLLQL